MENIEIGTSRSLGTAGRDMVHAGVAARRGEATQVTWDGQVVAAVIQAGPVSPLAAALADVDDAQARARAQLGGALGDFPRGDELRTLRELANAVRAQFGQPQASTS